MIRVLDLVALEIVRQVRIAEIEVGDSLADLLDDEGLAGLVLDPEFVVRLS